MSSGRRPLVGALLAALASGALPQQAAPGAQAPPADCDGPGALPSRFHFSYDARAARGPFSLEGENDLVFERDAVGYALHAMQRSLLFNAEQRSRGRLQGATLVPGEYVETSPRRAARVTRFDWDAATVHFSAGVDRQPAEPGMQDRLSLLLQLSLRARVAGTAVAVELPVAGVRHVSVYRFERRGVESLALPAGRLEAVKFERPMSAEHDRIEIWMAPALCWLPVRMRFTDDKGQVIDNRLRVARFG